MNIGKVTLGLSVFVLAVTTASGQPGPGLDKWFGLGSGESRHMHNLLKGQPTTYSPTNQNPTEAEIVKAHLKNLAGMRAQKITTYYIPEGRFAQILAESSHESHRGCFDGIETLHASSTFSGDILAALLCDAPNLRTLIVTGNWGEVEKDLASYTARDAGIARKINAAFARIPEVRINFGSTTQTGFDEFVQRLASFQRINAIGTGAGPLMSSTAWGKEESQLTDLRGLAKLRNIRTMEIEVEALAKVSIAFPKDLKHLTILENGLSKGSLAHVNLPPNLQTLIVKSDNEPTKQYFETLIRTKPKIKTQVDSRFLTSRLADEFEERSGVQWRTPEKTTMAGSPAIDQWEWEKWEKDCDGEDKTKMSMKIFPRNGRIELDPPGETLFKGIIDGLNVFSSRKVHFEAAYSFTGNYINLEWFESGQEPRTLKYFREVMERSRVQGTFEKPNVLVFPRPTLGEPQIAYVAKWHLGGTWRRVDIKFVEHYTPLPPLPEEEKVHPKGPSVKRGSPSGPDEEKPGPVGDLSDARDQAPATRGGFQGWQAIAALSAAVLIGVGLIWRRKNN